LVKNVRHSLKLHEKKREEKRTLIIQAAARLFAHKGYSGTAMADIAVRAEIGKGTIYEYFKSKEDLFFAVFEWFARMSWSEGKISVSAIGGTASQKLEVLSDSIMNTWTEMEEVYSLVMEFWAASASSQIRKRFKESFRKAYKNFRGIVSELIREGIANGEFAREVDPEAVAASLVGTWDALLLQAWFDDDFDPITAARKYITVLIRGMAI
jgi:AcrR family transcriptional regulator